MKEMRLKESCQNLICLNFDRSQSGVLFGGSDKAVDRLRRNPGLFFEGTMVAAWLTEMEVEAALTE